MAGFFVIGLIIIAPYAWVTIRRISRERDVESAAESIADHDLTVRAADPDRDPLSIALDQIQDFAGHDDADTLSHEITLATPIIAQGIELGAPLAAQLLGDTATQFGLRCDTAIGPDGSLVVVVTKPTT